jgi:hypothetical protein
MKEYCSLRLDFKGGYKADDGTVVQFHTDWMKSHQIEGDGLLPLLYHHLYKKDKDFKSSPGARIPHTVVYEHNFPRAWYSYEEKSGEITKRSGKFLDVHHIYNFFKKQTPYRGKKGKFCDIVAQYTYSRNCDDGSVEMNVEFLTEFTLYDFLHTRRNRPDGILQKFLIPKGTENTQIQAVYANRVTRIYKRTANFRLDDRTKTPYERAVTFDGPSHLSEESIVSEKVQAEVKTICKAFVDHFSATEHKPITRMCMFFKMDEFDKLWIISASSLRIGGTKFAPSMLRIPLNLATRFSSANDTLDTTNSISGPEFEENLLHRDMKLYSLSHDYLFTKLHCVNDDTNTRAQTARGTLKGPLIKYNDQIISPRNPFYTVVAERESNSPRSITMKSSSAKGGPVPPTPTRTPRYKRNVEWYTVDADVRTKYQTILRQEATVQCFIKDTVYDVYSSVLEDTPLLHMSAPATVEIPAAVIDVLSANELNDVLTALGLVKDDTLNIATRIEGAPEHAPVYQVLRKGDDVVQAIFDGRRNELRTGVPTHSA